MRCNWEIKYKNTELRNIIEESFKKKGKIVECDGALWGEKMCWCDCNSEETSSKYHSQSKWQHSKYATVQSLIIWMTFCKIWGRYMLKS